MAFWQALISPITSLVKTFVEPWQKRRTLKVETRAKVDEMHAQAEVSKAEALIEMAKNGQAIEADWDARAQEQMKFTIKDDVLMWVFITPFIAAFIPPLQPYVKQGFEIVAEIPLYWRVTVLGIVAASFGLRWLIAPLVSRWVRKVGGDK